jgi:hypothetical protein
MATTEVEQLIAKTGLQKKEISELLDIPPATLNRYKNGIGTMPEDKLEQLRKLAGGAKPALRALGSRKPATAVLAELPATALIEELARRARAGRITEPGAGNLDARSRSLRAVAFTDVADD